MTPEVAVRFASAFGSFLRETSGELSPTVVIARDGRPSGEMLMLAAMSGLAGVGCRVIDLGVQTTPTVGVMIDHRRATGGLIVTASHNPIQWNGLKCVGPDAAAPPKTDAERIIDRFRSAAPEYVETAALHHVERDDTGVETHVDRVLENVDADAIRQAGFRIVLDSVNASGGAAGRRLLEALGCEVVHLNGEPTGRFPHPPEPTREHLGELMAVAARENAHVGFAQDPDADRLAIVDEHGRYIGEEYTLALCTLQALESHFAAPDNPAGDAHPTTAGEGASLPSPPGRGAGGEGRTLAANLSTSRMIDDVAARFEHVEVLRTAVGEANVVEAMRRSHCLLGGEGNGGVIFPPVCHVRDSLSAMALVLCLLARRGQPLSAVVDELPRYEMIKRKFDLGQVGGRDAIPAILDRVKQSLRRDGRVSEVDGVRIDFAEGWVHLRPSNTEPIVRLIAEARTDEQAQALIARVADAAGVA